MLVIKRKATLLKAGITVVLIVFIRSVYYLFSMKETNVTYTGYSLASERFVNLDFPMQNVHMPLQNVNTSLVNHIIDLTQNEYKNISGSEFGDVQSVVQDKLLNSRLCDNVTRPKNTTYCSTGNYWHLQKNGKHEIMVYSIYYDDRPPVGIIPVLRLSVVSTLPKNAQVFCYLWYSGMNHPYVTTVSIDATGRGEKLFGTFYGQWLYSCKLPSSLPIPTHVSLSTTLCQMPSILVPIYVPVRTDWQHEFGICVAIAFGEVDFATLSEWIEFQRLFGVTEINIYNASMPERMNELFKVYKESGLLRVHQMPPPVPDYSKKGSKLGSPASLNDCMLRNMYRYKYMVVNDFDEFIVPRLHSNYSTMLKAIDKENKLEEPWFSYTFRNVYYFKDAGADKEQPTYLTTMRHRRRNAPNRYLFAPKSFISPLQCLSVFNHYCWIRFPTSPSQFTIDVSPTIAISQHYRYCGFKKAECKNLLTKSFQDDFMLQFKPFIESRVKAVLHSVRYNGTH